MKCKQLNNYIKPEFERIDSDTHLSNCKECSEQLNRINSAMELLDENIELPTDLTDKIVEKTKTFRNPGVHSFDYYKYIQIAALIIFGIFLGAFLGRNADSSMFLSKKEKKDKALMEYMEKHHLYDKNPLLMF